MPAFPSWADLCSWTKAAHGHVSNPDSRIQPFLRLMRVDKPTGTWLLLLPCWWGVALSAEFFPNLWLMFLFAMGAVVMRGAGCVVNDIYDRNLDCKVARTRDRPLACGGISLVQAVLFLVLLLLLGLGILLIFNRPTIIMGFLSLIFVFAYPLMKRVTWWPQLFLGFTFNWGALMGGVAATGKLDFAHVLLYIAGIFWTLGYDTIYAHQDKKDDAAIGVKSTALLFKDKSLLWISLFYALTMAFLAFAGLALRDSMGTLYYWGLLAAAIFAVVQLVIWKPDDPANCMARFNANRNFGLIVLGAIVLGKMI